MKLSTRHFTNLLIGLLTVVLLSLMALNLPAFAKGTSPTKQSFVLPSTLVRQDNVWPETRPLNRSGLLTTTTLMTHTEHFTAHTYQDLGETTADWNIFDGILTLPHLLSVTLQSNPSIAIDSDGNSYIVWEDYRNGDNDPDIYAQKFDANGHRLWPDDVRINSDSSPAEQLLPVITLDVDGNLVVIWQDGRHSFTSIYAQKFDSNGNKLWGIDYRIDDGNSANHYSPAAVLELSTGDIVVVWTDWRNNNSDIYFQRLKSDDTLRWPNDKRVNTDNGTASQSNPSISVDAANNVYVVWVDTRNNSNDPANPPEGDIYAQKINLNGIQLWTDLRITSDAVLLMNGLGSPLITTNTNGTSFIAWQYAFFNIYVQKVDTNAVKLWPEAKQVNWSNGGAFPSADLGAITLVNDGNFIMTLSRTPSFGTSDIYAQKLDPDGDRLWAIRVNSDVSFTHQRSSALTINASDDIWVAWKDERSDQGDIYLQKLDTVGAKLWPNNRRANNDINPAVYLAIAEARSLAVDDTPRNITWAALTVGSTVPADGDIKYFLSNNGGGVWAEVTPGAPHAFGTPGSNLRWRVILNASTDQTQTPIIDWLQLVYSTERGNCPSNPAPNTVCVLDENGPVPAARVYRNGQFAGVTDNDGVLIISNLQIGDTLTALQQIYEQPTPRATHNPDGGENLAFRIYHTSMPVTGDGEVGFDTVTNLNQQQTLNIGANNTLVLFNLVVSVEWDATQEQLEELDRAAQAASDYLYDLTDGQMAFGWVNIYDKGQYWTEADLQLLTKNFVHPHAFIGGISDNDKSHIIRVGRGWDRDGDNQQPWDASDGYRTLTHEFAHYALYVYDEYFRFELDQNGRPTGQKDYSVSCTGPENRNPATDAVNASAMDYHYTSSEFSARYVPGMWSGKCEQTAQWQLNPTLHNFTDEGESVWETIARKYADNSSPARWQLTTPPDRGNLMPGPSKLPDNILAVPLVTFSNIGVSPPVRHLTVVYGPNDQRLGGAIVALYEQGNGRVIGQGFTDNNGQMYIYGAAQGDMLRVSSFDGGLSGKHSITADTEITLKLNPVGNLSAQAKGDIPHMRVVAEAGQNPGQIDLAVALHNFKCPDADPLLKFTEPGDEVGHAPFNIPCDPVTNVYTAVVSFSANKQGMGRVWTRALVDDNDVRMQSTYRLQRVINDQKQVIYSNDGNLSLDMSPGSLPGQDAYFVVMPPGAVPGPLKTGWVLVGDPYDITASGALVTLEQPGTLKLHYGKTLVNQTSAPPGLDIFWWNPNNKTWQAIPDSRLDEELKAMVAPIRGLGTYALLAPPGPWSQPGSTEVFLPVILK